MENSLHWSLDIISGEGDGLIQEKQFQLVKKGCTRLKRKRDGWDLDFLEQVVCPAHA